MSMGSAPRCMMVRRGFLIFGAMIIFLIATTWAFYLQDKQEDAAREEQRQTGFAWYEKSVALVVGVGNYSLRWPSNPHAVANAEKVAQELERQGFVVYKLLNEQATKAEIERIFRDVLTPSLGPRDRFVFYFSGFAESEKRDKDNDLGYLVPADATYNWFNRYSSLICLNVLHRYVDEKFAAKHSLLVIDHCLRMTANYPEMEPIYRIDHRLNARNIQVLLPGYECNVRDTSVFTNNFVRAISGEADRNGDDHIDINELFRFVRCKVIKESRACRQPLLASQNSRSGIVFRYDTAALLANRLNPPPPTDEEKVLPIPMVRIEPGTFLMGTREDAIYSRTFRNKTLMRVGKPFLIGKTEVTQGQWRAVMGDNPSYHQCCGDDCPVENVSWFDAVIFCNRLSQVEHLTPCYRITTEEVAWDRACNGYRLPTDEEWEYAARAGTDAATPVGDVSRENPNASIASFAWSYETSFDQTMPVAWKNPNAWELHDVLGNVAEMVWTCYREKNEAWIADDMTGPAQCRHRVTRGESFNTHVNSFDIGERQSIDWRECSSYTGIRLARSLAGEPSIQKSVP